MNTSTDREIDLLYGEIVDVRTLYRAIEKDFGKLKARFNAVIITSAILSLVMGGLKAFELIRTVF